jgi:hypothetical protein
MLSKNSWFPGFLRFFFLHPQTFLGATGSLRPTEEVQEEEEMKIDGRTLRRLSLVFLVVGIFGLSVSVVPELEITVTIVSVGSVLLAGLLFAASRLLC